MKWRETTNDSPAEGTAQVGLSSSISRWPAVGSEEDSAHSSLEPRLDDDSETEVVSAEISIDSAGPISQVEFPVSSLHGGASTPQAEAGHSVADASLDLEATTELPATSSTSYRALGTERPSPRVTSAPAMGAGEPGQDSFSGSSESAGSVERPRSTSTSDASTLDTSTLDEIAGSLDEMAGMLTEPHFHLGTGLAARVDRDEVAGSQPAVSVVPTDWVLPPELQDTQRLEVSNLKTASPSESSIPPDGVGESDKRHGWWTRFSLARFLAGSLASSAEAGGKFVDQAVGLAFGTGTTLTLETQRLLHQRLCIATLLLFFGFVASLVVESFFFEGLHGPAENLRFWSEVALTAVLGLIGWRLVANCPKVFRNLRKVEFFVFGSASWILALNSWVLLEQGATAKHAVSLSGPWQALVFTYALFIPNHWQRAMSAIASMAFAPVAITIVAAFSSPLVGRLALESMEYTHGLVTLCLMSAFATVAATWGVYTIGSLRSEVFSAKQFGQYRLSRLLGSGGMGEVYVGEHVLLKRPCAIKVIKPQQANDPKMLERFEREVRSTAKLTHWNTVAIYDYGRAEDGTFFYVMEYLPGLNLSQVVKLFGPLHPGRVVHLLVQICDALAEAHHQGMVHRDIKPANIFASKRGSKYDVAKLLDFGLVRRMVRQTPEAESIISAAVGSPLFMSPEQATGRPMDHRSDIYSLGITAFYLLTGKPPFSSADPIKVLRAHASQPPPSFSELDCDVPSDLAQIVAKCIAKRPEDRFEDVDELRAALASCDCVSEWTWGHAAQWWKLHRCPEKSSLDLAIEHERLADWLESHQPVEAARQATA